MASDPGTPTLDQLRVFLTVVDVGSFAGAARKLNRATSVISYSISNLEAQLGVSGPLPGNAGVAGIERIGVGDVALIPVASPDHPLARAGKKKPGAARDHVQLVLTDRSPLTGKTDFAVVSPRTWRLADLGSKHMLLKEGIGWGNMPVPMVQEDLDSGRLVHLDLPDIKGGIYR